MQVHTAFKEIVSDGQKLAVRESQLVYNMKNVFTDHELLLKLKNFDARKTMWSCTYLFS